MYGLHLAIYNEDTNKFEKPIPILGSVNFSLTPEGDTAQFFADNHLFHVQTQDNGFTGDLQMARFPEDYLVAVLGWVFDDNGMLVEVSSASQKPHALLFEVMGTNSPLRVVLYNCIGSKPTRSYRTNETSPRFEGESMSITVTPFDFGWISAAKASIVKEENHAAFDSFFNAVMEPKDPLTAKPGGGDSAP